MNDTHYSSYNYVIECNIYKDFMTSYNQEKNDALSQSQS